MAKEPEKCASHRRFNTDYVGQGKPSFSSESRFRVDLGRRLLLLKGHLLPRSQTSRCRRTERRPTSASDPSKTDLGKRKRPPALRRVLPEITGGVLCGDKAYCDGPLKEQLEGAACRDSGVGPDHSSQKGERAEDAPGSRQALFGGHRPVETTNRVSFQLDRRENGHSTGLKGAFLPGFARACVRSACCCNADSRSQPLIRIIYEHLPAVGRFFHPHTGRSAAGTSTLG